jgi:hypothetical protein
MTSDKVLIFVSFVFILFTVIFTAATASFVCIETNDSTKKKENNNE